jgi:hypothetical protein
VCRTHCFPDFSIADSFCLRKVTTGPHTIADINIACPDDSFPKLKFDVSELILDRYKYIPVVYVTIRNNALHYLTVIKLIVAGFVGIEFFLIRYCSGPTN